MLNLRPAVPTDAPLILQYIRELAEYEREPEAEYRFDSSYDNWGAW